LEVETAVSGFDALDRIKRNLSYDIIFMDHMMPDMDGVETTKLIRETGYDKPIIAFTANALVGSKEMFKANGFDGFISKPIDPHRLNAELNKFIRDRYPEEAQKYKGYFNHVKTLPPKKDPKLLQIFSREAKATITVLRDSIAANDLKLFTIKAHAMKSALANIGETKLSGAALSLENAGHNGDKDYIAANTEAFIKNLEILVDGMSPTFAEENTAPPVAENTEYLTEQLKNVVAACEDYNDTGAYKALDSLKADSSLKRETLDIIEEIRDAIYMRSDFEEAAQIAELTIRRLAEKSEQKEAVFDGHVYSYSDYLVYGDYESALGGFLSSISSEPQNTLAYIGAANAYLCLNNIDAAVKILKKGYNVSGDEDIREKIHMLRGKESVGDPELKSKTTLNFYAFQDEFKYDIMPFIYEQNPDFLKEYNVNVITEVWPDKYIDMVENALQNESVDIFVAEFDFALEFAENPETAPVKSYFSLDENDYYGYLTDMVRVNGDVMGLSHQATPGVMYYRTDLAEKCLGVTSPAEMQKLVSTWDGFLETADKLKANDVFITYGVDELLRSFIALRGEGWVTDGKLTIDEDTVRKFFEITKTLYDKQQVVHNKNSHWTVGWEMGALGNIFCYFGTTWYLHYCLKRWTKEDALGPDEVGNGTWGLWGMIPGPSGYSWGGTYWFVPKALVNDDERAHALSGVKKIISTMCVNDETMKNYAYKTGDFLSKRTVVEAIKNDERFINPFLNGQNHYAAFSESVENISAKNFTVYDECFETFFNQAINDFFSCVEGGCSFEESYNQAMYEFVKNAESEGIDVSDYQNKFRD